MCPDVASIPLPVNDLVEGAKTLPKENESDICVESWIVKSEVCESILEDSSVVPQKEDEPSSILSDDNTKVTKLLDEG